MLKGRRSELQRSYLKGCDKRQGWAERGGNGDCNIYWATGKTLLTSGLTYVWLSVIDLNIATVQSDTSIQDQHFSLYLFTILFSI